MVTPCKRSKKTKRKTPSDRASSRGYVRRRKSCRCVSWDDHTLLIQPPSPNREEEQPPSTASATTPGAVDREELLEATTAVIDVSQLDDSAPILEQIVQQVTEKSLLVADGLIHRQYPRRKSMGTTITQTRATQNALREWLTSPVIHRLETALLNPVNYQSGFNLTSLVAQIIWEELGTTLIGVVTEAGHKVAALMRTETPDIAAEQAAAKEEQARLAAEQAAAEGQLIAEEQARLSAEKEGAEEQARMAAEQAAAEKQLIAEEQARLAAEQAAAKEEQARLATEQAAAEEQAAANEEQARLAAEQAAAEEQAAANEEQARLAAEQAAANEEQARMAAEKEAARVASEQVAAEKQARVAAEQATAEEQAAAEEQARLGAEKEAAEEQARLAAEKEAAEEQARLAAEKEAAEEQARLAAEKAEAAIMEQCRSYTQLPQSEPTTHGFAIVDYKDTIYRTPPMLSYDVPGDGRCFYHAVAACLRGSADTWSEIEKDETNLCSLLHEKLNKFRNIQENDSTVAVDSTFLQWLIIEFLETVPPDHPLFTNTSVEGTPILVVDESKSSEDALTPAQLIARIKNSCVEGWGGRQEAFVLHYALKGLVTVIMMHANVGSDGLSLLMNASNCSHQDDDRAFIFLEHTNSSHWRALSLLQGIVQNFIVPLTTLRRQQELVNKCTHKGSIAGNMIKSQVPYSNGTQLVVIGPEESNFYGALAVALHITKLENGDEWDDAMCRALRQQYDRFQVTHTSLDPSLADTMFIEYLCRDATNKESIFSVMDAMEDALDNLCRINLHRRGGIVKRSKPRKLDHAAKTYELNVYQEGDAKITKDKISPRHNMYIAINQGQPIQSDKDQAYVTREGYTAPPAIAVLSGVFRAAQSLPQELDAMGYLGFDDESYKPNRTKKTENYRIDAGTCAPSNIVNLAHLPGGDSMGEADTRNLSSCGLEAIQLVEPKHRLQLPVTRAATRTMWKTLVGRHLSRFDFLYLLLASGRYKHPSATTFFLCNGIIWKFVLVNPGTIATMDRNILLDGINGVFLKLDQPDTQVSIDSKLTTMLEFLQKAGIQGTAAIMKYSGIEEQHISPPAKETAPKGFFSRIFGGDDSTVTIKHYQDVLNRVHRKGRWS